MKIHAPLNTEPAPILQEVEVATFFQLPSFQIIGLPSPEVAEARERVRSAIEASGNEFPRRRVVLNLSPAYIRKRGTGLDLSMALAILAFGKESSLRIGAWGELGLDGGVKPAGQMTRTLYAAWKGKLDFLFLAEADYPAAQEALICIYQSGEVQGEPPQLIPISTLDQAWQLLNQGSPESRDGSTLKEVSPDFSHVLEGNESSEIENSFLLPLSPSLERILGVAAAGRHHLLLLGPRGTGKSHALEWYIAIQPPITPFNRFQQRLVAELSRSGSSKDFEKESMNVPIRRVSSQVRPSALTGGASSLSVRPGEFSLAHGGVLVADELPEWSRDSREVLREPLERGAVTLSRVHGALELPARFNLAANGNLCPCGGLPPHLPIPAASTEGKSPKFGVTRCKCSDTSRHSYLARLSGPLLDRIDITLFMTKGDPSEALTREVPKRLRSLKEKVVRVRETLKKQWGEFPGLLSGGQVESILQTHPRFKQHLAELPHVSLRSRHKIARVALTLSAWDGFDLPADVHLTEAACYRGERYLGVDE